MLSIAGIVLGEPPRATFVVDKVDEGDPVYLLKLKVADFIDQQPPWFIPWKHIHLYRIDETNVPYDHPRIVEQAKAYANGVIRNYEPADVKAIIRCTWLKDPKAKIGACFPPIISVPPDPRTRNPRNAQAYPLRLIVAVDRTPSETSANRIAYELSLKEHEEARIRTDMERRIWTVIAADPDNGIFETNPATKLDQRPSSPEDGSHDSTFYEYDGSSDSNKSGKYLNPSPLDSGTHSSSNSGGGYFMNFGPFQKGNPRRRRNIGILVVLTTFLIVVFIIVFIALITTDTLPIKSMDSIVGTSYSQASGAVSPSSASSSTSDSSDPDDNGDSSGESRDSSETTQDPSKDTEDESASAKDSSEETGGSDNTDVSSETSDSSADSQSASATATDTSFADQFAEEQAAADTVEEEEGIPYGLEGDDAFDLLTSTEASDTSTSGASDSSETSVTADSSEATESSGTDTAATSETGTDASDPSETSTAAESSETPVSTETTEASETSSDISTATDNPDSTATTETTDSSESPTSSESADAAASSSESSSSPVESASENNGGKELDAARLSFRLSASRASYAPLEGDIFQVVAMRSGLCAQPLPESSSAGFRAVGLASCESIPIAGVSPQLGPCKSASALQYAFDLNMVVSGDSGAR
ncbi:hypothetical protein HK405_007826, partial [Cladochytrium tenue]